MELYNVVGVDELEGTIFARCSTYENATEAVIMLANEAGIESIIDVVRNDIPTDAVMIDGKVIKVGKSNVQTVIERLMAANNENFNIIDTYEDKSYAKGYTEGIHDGLLATLKNLGFESEEEYYN